MQLLGQTIRTLLKLILRFFFQEIDTNLYSPCTRVPVSLHPHQHRQWPVFSLAKCSEWGNRGIFIHLIATEIWFICFHMFISNFKFWHMNYLLMPFSHLSTRDLVLLLQIWTNYFYIKTITLCHIYCRYFPQHINCLLRVFIIFWCIPLLC